MGISISENSNNITLSIEGRMDLYTSPGYKKEMLDAINGKKLNTVTVEMSKVDYVDSSAIGVILQFAKVAKETSSEVLIKSPSDSVIKILNLGNFDKFFKIV